MDKFITRGVSGLLFFVFIISFSTAQALTGSEVRITSDGKASVAGAKVIQIAGSTIFTRLYWGDSYVRLMVKTNSKTKFLRGTGEATAISEVKMGDYLEMLGELESGGDSLVLIPTSVKNSSVQKQQTVFTGKVVSIDLSARSFSLNTTKTGVITVSTSGAKFTKGNRSLDLEHVQIGDTITKVSGDYDFNTKTLVANSVVTYMDMSYYKPKNFEGVLQEVMGTTLPTSIKVLVGKTSFLVNLSQKTSILSKNKSNVLLSRFVVGDVVRMYGTIEEIDDPVMDIDIIRNMNL